MTENTVPLGEVHSAYLEGRRWALAASPDQVAGEVDLLEQGKARLDATELARLRALLHVQEDRS